MKTLKLDHELAQLIASGQKTSTWRLFDDKDISVGDEIELIDKVDPHNRGTWYPIGVANVTSVVEKRLGAITEADYDGRERYESQDAMVSTFQKYYGPDVSLQTPVKIISFEFQPVQKAASESQKTETKPIKEIKLFADGGSRGNPGPSASGFVLYDMSGNILLRHGVYLGITTNNQAEYLALKFGLEEALKRQARIVHVHLDSLLVVNQMTGKFKIKNRDLWPIHAAIKDLVAKFEQVTFVHVPRALNKEADAVVNETLDKEAENNLSPSEVI